MKAAGWVFSLIIAGVLFTPGDVDGQTKSGRKMKEPFDGFTFAGRIQERGKEQSAPDTLIFQGCQFRSAGCIQYGFKNACYTAGKTTGAQTFEVEATSVNEGTMVWKGTISGDAAEAVVVWTKKDQKPVEYTFTGTRIVTGEKLPKP
jgi:hypothetical protein